MLLRLIPISALLLSTSGCLKGKLDFQHGDCEAGQAKSKLGNCAASATAVLATSAAVTNANPILVTATFPKEVEDFAASRVTISNASVASITGAGKDYVLSITPIKEGEITLVLGEGAAKSFSGTPSAASNQLSIIYDRTAPTLELISMNRSTVDTSTTSDPTLNVLLSESARVTLYGDDTCSVSISAPKDMLGTSDESIAVDGIEKFSAARIYGQAVDSAGNASACTSLARYSHILKFTDPNPGVNSSFGTHIVELANGNVVITAPQATVNGVAGAGAVYLFNGTTGALISTLYGSTASDGVGSGGVTVLTNGNYVIASSGWDCPAGSHASCPALVNNAGAVTWVHGTSGIDGPVTPDNSLFGTTASDAVGGQGVVALTNGNYVVQSSNWDCLAGSHASCPAIVAGAGAATWADGTNGITGPVTPSNSLFGVTANDAVGQGVTALSNGNYVVRSGNWDCPAGSHASCAGLRTDAGAVTWGNGTTGITGPVTPSNSLFGQTASDQVGAVTALSNGNYLVISFNWDCPAGSHASCAALRTNAGAVTWVNGTTGVTGPVTPSNSLFGTTSSDGVGGQGVIELTNGNYVVSSSTWDCPAGSHASCPALVTNAGAVTWGNGTTGVTGPVTPSNSLFGTTLNDQVGSFGVTALSNGNYVVGSPNWDCLAGSHASCPALVTDAGASTWGNGTTGITGPVTPSNSLFGTTASDQVGSPLGVVALSNGNYVVRSSNWDCPAGSHASCPVLVTNAGAVTWGNGTTGSTGPVTPSNSLFGTTTSDVVGVVHVLNNGNYVVESSNWDCPAGSHASCPALVTNAGAVTWGNGTTGSTGPVMPINSLFGITSSDQVGSQGILKLSNSNYVVRSPSWDCPAGSHASCPALVSDAGAVTWGNGTTGSTGPVMPSNSLFGTSASDRVGSSGVTALTNGNYVVRSSSWDGLSPDLGAVTLGIGTSGVSGPVNSSNSIVGANASDYLGSSTATATSDGGLIFRSHLYNGNLGLVIKIPGDGSVGGSL